MGVFSCLGACGCMPNELTILLANNIMKERRLLSRRFVPWPWNKERNI